MTHITHDDGVTRSYSQATIHRGVVYPCGQIPTQADGSTPEGIRQQTLVCLDNLEATLLRCGSSLGNVLQTTVFLAHQEDFATYDEAWRSRFAELALPPRTTLFVAGFRGTKRIELSAIAAIDKES